MPKTRRPSSLASRGSLEAAFEATTPADATNAEIIPSPDNEDEPLVRSRSTSAKVSSVKKSVEKKSLMLRQLEVTEGVDMFKEKFAADDPIKTKAGIGLRANPKQVDVLDVLPNGGKKKKLEYLFFEKRHLVDVPTQTPAPRLRLFSLSIGGPR